MSSTTGIQNFLVNVFRPVYVYDSTTALFTPKLELSNVDTYSGNSISVFTAAVGDANSNVYVGSNAGNPYTNLKNCSNVTAVGYGAGSNVSNVSSSTYLGWYAGAGALSANAVIAIGTNAGGNGFSNIVLGNGTGATGSNNILVGHGIVASDNTLQIGTTLYGNLSTKWIGIGRSTPYDPNNHLDVSGNAYILGQVGINTTPGNRTLDVNGDFRTADASGNILNFQQGVTTSTGGFGSTNGTLSNINAGITQTIGTLKKGVILVSAQDPADSTKFDSTMVYCADPANGTYTAPMTSNLSPVDITILFQAGGSNIQISNASVTRSIAWSITYAPLP